MGFYKMDFIKLGVCHLDKTFFISNVSEECFNNSENIERAGLFEVFKIKSSKDLEFRINELKRLNYCEENY